MTLSRNYACQRLSALGLKQVYVHAIIDAVELWTKRSGSEWTVSRLKTLKTHFIHRLAQDGVKTLDWVASKDGIPRGPFRRLFLDMSTTRKRVRALNALMVYSGYVSAEVTPTQWKKFSGSVEQKVTSSELSLREEKEFQSWLDKPRSRKGLALKEIPLGPWTEWPDVPWEAYGTRVPLFTKDKVKSVPIKEIESWYPASESNPWLRWYFGTHPRLALSIALNRKPVLSDWISGEPSQGCVGKVSFIQEPGYKLRAVANPDPLVQLSLEPLKKGLLDLLKSLDRDCTHNQQSGIEAVQGWLRDGQVVHSIDLSDATNNFPLSLQRKVLDVACPVGPGAKPLAYGLNRGFIAAAQGPWMVHDPELKTQRVMRWTKGQPLGLGPSFPLFAMTHHALVQYAISGLSLEDQARCDYRVLGDDVAITGDALASRYRELLDTFGCPVSEAKCLVSDKVAEFAGKVILSDEVLSSFKWRQVSDDNFLEVCKQLGPMGLNLLRPKQRAVARVLASIPEWYGGLGFNPRGESLETRTALALKLGLLEDSVNRVNYTEAASLRTRNLINSGVQVPRPAYPWELYNPFTGVRKSYSVAPNSDVSRNRFHRFTDAVHRSNRPDPRAYQVEIASEIGISDIQLEEHESREGYVPSGRKQGDPRKGPRTTLEIYSHLVSSPGGIPVCDASELAKVLESSGINPVEKSPSVREDGDPEP